MQGLVEPRLAACNAFLDKPLSAFVVIGQSWRCGSTTRSDGRFFTFTGFMAAPTPPTRMVITLFLGLHGHVSAHVLSPTGLKMVFGWLTCSMEVLSHPVYFPLWHCQS